MSRTLSSLLTTAVRAQETKSVLLALITITHSQIIGGPLRLVQDLQDLVSNGNTYTAFPFRIMLPEDSSDSVPTVKLSIDNVDQQVMATIKNLPPESPPTIQVDIVLASTPNTVEISLPNLVLRSVTGDLMTIDGELRSDEEDLTEFPEGSFTPQHFPGLFA